MLYASGTARKDAPAVAAHRNLRANHRQIMNSLSKLVLSAKLASGVHPPPEAVGKMQACCHEVLVAVKHFVTSAVEADISIHNIEDLHSEHGYKGSESTVFAGNGHGNPQSSAELISYLERYTRSVVKMISSLMKSIRAEECNSSTLIADVRSMVTEVGNFLASVDELPIDTLTDELSVDFKVNRLALYNSISGLVMATQTATSPLAPSNALEQVVLSTGLVEKAVKDLLISTKFLIEEKEALDMSKNSEGVLSAVDLDELIKPRRTVSLSALAPPILTPIPESELQQLPFSATKAPESALNSKDYPKSAGPGPAPRRPFEDEHEKRKSTGRDKIKKFFGEVPDNKAAGSSMPVREARPHYMEYDYDPNDILFNMEGKVKGGSLEALIERLTLHDSFSMLHQLTP